MGVAEETKELLDQKLEEKRKQTKKEGKTSIKEDDPIKVSCLCKIEYFTTHSFSPLVGYSRASPLSIKPW